MRDAIENKQAIQKSSDEFFADFNMYTSMAHYVGKILKIRPNEILDTWSVPELIVAYGYYADEQSYKNYNELADLDAKSRAEYKAKHGEISKYAVKFYGASKLDE